MIRGEKRKEIEQLSDIKIMVDTFYNKVRKDEVLKDIFDTIIKDKWPQHLNKMYRFWQTVLLEEHTYSGSPFAPHAKLPIDKNHFERWLKLFSETINENFTGTKADEALWRAQKMAEMFNYKIQYFKQNSSTPIV